MPRNEMMGGGMPPQEPQGPGLRADTAMERNRSPLNPDDAMMMGKTGEMGGDMSIGQFFESMGISWETPLTEALPKMQKSVENAGMPGKMHNIAQDAQGGMPPGGMPQGGMPPTGPPPQGGGLDDLMGRLGG